MLSLNTAIYNPNLGICALLDNNDICFDKIKIVIPTEFFKQMSMRTILANPNVYFYEVGTISYYIEPNVEYICVEAYRIIKGYKTIAYYGTKQEAKDALAEIYEAINKKKNITLL